MKLSVGSDPEIFLKDKQGNPITAIGLIGGTKSRPRKTKHGSVQEDGCAAEFNSLPAYSLEEFIRNHNLILGDLTDILKPLDLELDLYSPSVNFRMDQLNSEQAQTSGCLPDYNAWMVAENPIVDLYEKTLRVAGGHLHIGFDCNGMADMMSFTKVLDMHLGVPSVILDNDKERRELYGKAGAHRPKFKKKDGFDGIEYRTLSNFWLRSDQLMSWVYNQVEHVNSNWKELTEVADDNGEEIQHIINTGDSEGALSFCDHHEISYGLL